MKDMIGLIIGLLGVVTGIIAFFIAEGRWHTTYSIGLLLITASIFFNSLEKIIK